MVLVTGYGAARLQSSAGTFLDPTLQNDDARIHLMPLHRYDGHGTLADDPVATDMLAYSTLGLRLLYRALVPIVGVFVAAKIVQALCFAVLLGCAVFLAAHRRGGLASGLLLAFLLLHSPEVFDRTAGGLQRGFAFPVLTMWLAGALTRTPGLRAAATLLGAVTYPTAGLIALAAEGFLRLQPLRWPPAPSLRRGLIGLTILASACFLLVRLDAALRPDGGRLPTYTEASENPALGPHGRLHEVPLPNPLRVGGSALSSVLGTRWADRTLRSAQLADAVTAAVMLSVVGLFVVPVLYRYAPLPRAAIALATASTVLYAVARVFAFRLYLPERYLTYGMAMAALALVVSSASLLWIGTRDRQRRVVRRNLTAGAVVVGLIAVGGDRLVENQSMTISRTEMAGVWDYVAALPASARIAAHPLDADGISFWTGRAATPGREQLQPLLDRSWERNSALARATLGALYATRREDLLHTCAREGITHLLVNQARYRRDFRLQARLFEPLGGFVDELLQDVRLDDLALSSPPETAVALRWKDYLVLDVAALRRYWSRLRASAAEARSS